MTISSKTRAVILSAALLTLALATLMHGIGLFYLKEPLGIAGYYAITYISAVSFAFIGFSVYLQSLAKGESPYLAGVCFFLCAVVVLAHCIGLYNIDQNLSTKGYYLMTLISGVSSSLMVSALVKQ